MYRWPPASGEEPGGEARSESQEQARGLEQISKALSQVEQVAQKAAANGESLRTQAQNGNPAQANKCEGD